MQLKFIYDNIDLIGLRNAKNQLKDSAAFNLFKVNYSVFNFLPKNFIISTNNSSYEFNSDMLKDTSLVISQILTDDPQNLKYHIDIDDDKGVIKKIEQMYYGEKVTYNSNELFTIQKFSEILKISNFPDFMKPYNLQNQARTSMKVKQAYEVHLETKSLINFLQTRFDKPFTIKLKNGKEFKCNFVAVQSSNVIKEMIKENPDLDTFTYDFEDEDDDFQVICDLFNFSTIQITINNMNSLKQFAEDLQINCIINKINDFIDSYETASQTIDDKHLIIDTIDQIFDLLFHINDQPIEFVKNSIVNSIWCQSEESVQELAACILQVIQTNFLYHQNLFDLIVLLDNEKNEFVHLKFLVPILNKVLMKSFGSTLLNCAFVYRLYKNGMISKDDLNHKLIICINNYLPNDLNERKKVSRSFLFYEDQRQKQVSDTFLNILSWFLPEILKIRKISKNTFSMMFDSVHLNFFKKYLPDEIDNYKKMRDCGEPDDTIAKVIIKDDLDTLQSIFSQFNDFLTFDSNVIPYNIYDSFIENGSTRYINYAAAYGSINCFKYLLLNHAQIDKFTFQYAVYGGNIEIIRIVDQFYNETNVLIEYEFCEKINSNKLKYSLSKSQDLALNPIIPAIVMHHNDLFDWILQEKYLKNGLTEYFYDLFVLSSMHGNAHSLIGCIDNGLNLDSKINSIAIECASENGFYKYLQLLLSLMEKTIHLHSSNIQSSISFGNLMIFKLYLSYNNQIVYFDDALYKAVSCDHFEIVKYIFENIFKDEFKLTRDGILESLQSSISKNSPIFNYLINQFGFDKLIEKYKLHSIDFVPIINQACSSDNFENVKIITDLIFDKFPDADFTNPFMFAIQVKGIDICKYFIDKELYINLYTLSNESSKLKLIDVEIFRLLIQKADPEMKEILLGSFLYESLESYNFDLAEYLLNQNIPYENALFEAVRSHEIEMVKIVIKRDSQPSFINQISEVGTALNLAVQNNDYNIVEYLLSIPEIDVDLYEQYNYTPLITAITNFNMPMINLLLDYYGDKIESQAWQLNIAIEGILEKIYNNENENNHLGRFDRPVPIDHQKVLNVIKRLLEIKNVDLNYHSRKYTLLTFACKANDYDLVKMLVESNNVDINSYAPNNGNTPLMTVIENKNLEISKLLIQSPRININLRNYKKETALTLAVKNEFIDVIPFIINNKNFDCNKSRLDYAFFISTGEISSKLLSVEKLDVNYRLYLKVNEKFDTQKEYSLYRDESTESPCNSGIFETSLIHSVMEKDIDKLKLIIQHPSFDPVKSQVKTAIFTAAKFNQVDIFNELLKLVDNDVTIHFLNGDSLLTHAVIYKSEDIVEEIINNENFDSNKNDLLKAFLKTFSFEKNVKNNSNYYNNNNNNNLQDEIALPNSMELIYNYDEQHNHLIDFKKLLPSGNSYFTSIFFNCVGIGNIVEFFLNHGVDPDLPDEKGVYPLEHAIRINSYPIANLLIESNRIDFKRTFPTINDFTYLHLAAQEGNERIFINLMNLNIIDINSVDANGETPLLIAARKLNIIIIQHLFLDDNLDYMHVNKNGEDVINIAKLSANILYRKNRRRSRTSAQPIQIAGPLKTKGDYLSLLIALINSV